MHISRVSLIVIVAYGSSVAAAPAQGNCNPVDAIYAILKGPLQALASSFCLAWLGGDKTTTTTQTVQLTGAGRTVTATAPDQTQQATAQVTNVNQVTVTQQVTQQPPTQTVVVVVTAAQRTIYQRRRNGIKIQRNNRPQCPPAPLIFGEQKVLSACSCIVTPTTKTVYNIAMKSVAGPQTTTQTRGRTVIVTVTQTLQVTTEVDVTQIVQGSVTPVQTIQTTVIVFS